MQKNQKVSLMLHRMRECTRSLIHSGGTASQLSTRMMMPTGTGSTKESDVVSLPGGAFGIALRQLRYVLNFEIEGLFSNAILTTPMPYDDFASNLSAFIHLYLAILNSPLLPMVDYMLRSSKL